MSRKVAIQVAGGSADDPKPYPRPGDAEREQEKKDQAQTQFERWQARQRAREAG